MICDEFIDFARKLLVSERNRSTSPPLPWRSSGLRAGPSNLDEDEQSFSTVPGAGHREYQAALWSPRRRRNRLQLAQAGPAVSRPETCTGSATCGWCWTCRSDAANSTRRMHALWPNAPARRIDRWAPAAGVRQMANGPGEPLTLLPTPSNCFMRSLPAKTCPSGSSGTSVIALS